jgi:hypothetical protein
MKYISLYILLINDNIFVLFLNDGDMGTLNDSLHFRHENLLIVMCLIMLEASADRATRERSVPREIVFCFLENALTEYSILISRMFRSSEYQ